jgi:hypothetical protein
MVKLEISFDGEEHLFYSVVCFILFCFVLPNMIWFDSIFRSLHRPLLYRYVLYNAFY